MTVVSKQLGAIVFEQMLEQATVSAWIIDENETIVYVNPEASKLSGYETAELLGMPVSMLMDDETASFHASRVSSYACNGGDSAILGRICEFEMRHKEGHFIPIELKAFALGVQQDARQLFGALIADNRQHKARQQELARIARVDHLTGCLNRLGFMERAAQEISRAHRNAQSLALVVMDIDFFKNVNDQYGHQAGDMVLAELAPRLRKGLRAQDELGRVGGEEFFFLLPQAERRTATQIAERVRCLIQDEPFRTNGFQILITASLGCSQLRADDTLDDLIGRADRRMYKAKQSGRNRVVSEQPKPESAPVSGSGQVA